VTTTTGTVRKKKPKTNTGRAKRKLKKIRTVVLQKTNVAHTTHNTAAACTTDPQRVRARVHVCVFMFVCVLGVCITAYVVRERGTMCVSCVRVSVWVRSIARNDSALHAGYRYAHI